MLILKAGELVQHCLLLAVLQVCRRTSPFASCWAGGVTRAAAVPNSKPHTRRQHDSMLSRVVTIVATIVERKLSKNTEIAQLKGLPVRDEKRVRDASPETS